MPQNLVQRLTQRALSDRQGGLGSKSVALDILPIPLYRKTVMPGDIY